MYGMILAFLLFFTYIAYRNIRVALYLILIFIPLYVVHCSIFSIPTTLLEILIYISFAIWLFLISKKWEKFNYSILKPYILPISIIFLGLIIGTIFSVDKITSLGIIKGWFVDPILLFIMLTNLLHSQVHIKKVITALMVSGVGLSFIAIYQVISNNYITIDQRASAVFSSANYLALYLVPIIVLGLGLSFVVNKQRKYWICSAVIIILTALYFTFSYGGWLGAAIGVALLMSMFFPKKYIVPSLFSIVALGLITQWNHPKFQQLLNLTGQSSSSARLQIWKSSWLMIKEKYLTGVGLGMFEKRYLEFAKRIFDNPEQNYTLHAHNIFLNFWVNTGIIGLLGFILLLVNFFKQTITSFKLNKTILLGSVISAMIALLVHGLVDTAYWKNDLSVLFWTVLALGIILSKNEGGGKRKNISYRN